MTAALRFDPIRLPEKCEQLRKEVRAFLDALAPHHLGADDPVLLRLRQELDPDLLEPGEVAGP